MKLRPFLPRIFCYHPDDMMRLHVESFLRCAYIYQQWLILCWINPASAIAFLMEFAIITDGANPDRGEEHSPRMSVGISHGRESLALPRGLLSHLTAHPRCCVRDFPLLRAVNCNLWRPSCDHGHRAPFFPHLRFGMIKQRWQWI